MPPGPPPRRTEHHALATFAIPIEHRVPTAKAAQPASSSDLRFAAPLVTALTLLALLIHGYHPYAEDGGLYLTGIQRLLDPALFPHSTVFVLEPTRLSLFAPTIAAIVRISQLSLPQAGLTLHLASVWITLFAAWMLAARTWPTRSARAGAITLLACWLSLPVAGTALVLMDPYLTARSLSTPCMVFALVATLDATSASTRRSRLNAILCCIAALAFAVAMHPLMAAYALGATAVLACLRSADSRMRQWSTAILSTAAMATAAILHTAAKPESSIYNRITLTRTYWFPTQWRWYELIGLVAPLAILVFFAFGRTTNKTIPPAYRALTQMAIVSGSIAFLVAILFAHPTSSPHLVARLQPLRIFQIVYFILVLTLGARLGEFVLKRSLWRWSAAVLLLGGIMFSAARNVFPNSPHLELPSTLSQNPWVEAFVWIRQHTPKDALFALDPDYISSTREDAQCFRAIAQRSALPDYSKDGGEASIAPDLTDAWTAGQQAQQNLNTTTDTARLATLTPLGVSWVVLNAQTATHFTCPYSNTAVKVCRLP